MDEMVIIAAIVAMALLISFCAIYYNYSHPENYLYYGNDDYCFCRVQVGSGRRGTDLYFGVVSIEDYNKWCNGEDSTMLIHSATKEGYGNRIRIINITEINNYGSKPDSLLVNFGW